METLISRYFDKQSERDGNDEAVIEDPAFPKKKVYNNIISAIRKKENNSRRWNYTFKIAASVILVCSVGILLYLRKDDAAAWLTPVKLVEKRVGKGQMILMKLEDGSRIWLNSDSKLTYPQHFDGKKREISLEGEAYFEVAHYDNKPFIIQSGDVKTVVLGTSFNIKAYPGNRKVEVTVVSGKVAVITPHKKNGNLKTVYVTPNQKVTYNSKDIEIRPYTVKAEESIGWKEGKMRFAGTPLIQVIEDIERKYNINLKCSDRIKDCTITADFNNERLDKVLKVMARMIDGSVSNQGGYYYLNGRGCE